MQYRKKIVETENFLLLHRGNPRKTLINKDQPIAESLRVGIQRFLEEFVENIQGGSCMEHDLRPREEPQLPARAHRASPLIRKVHLLT